MDGLLHEDAPSVLEDLRDALCGIDLESEQAMDDTLWEYTRLFVGPYKLPCPPWESVYTSPKRLMMQEAHDAVSDFYRKAGLAVGDPNVLQDHVGAELSFLAILYGKMETEPEHAPSCRELAERFLTEHLRKWIPVFSADLERAADSRIYKTLAKATRDLIGAG
jgi:TorA maturation chaperone TorD